MKRTILFITILHICIGVFSQIGINTEDPKQLFHIDSKGDNNTSGNFSDDTVITKDGKIGMGTLDPQATLDINGKFQYQDNNQQEGRVLTTDASGNANWKDEERVKMISSSNTNSILMGKGIYPTSRFMGPSLTLPPGSWQINFNATFENFIQNNTGMNIIWDLSTSSTQNTISGRAYSSAGQGPPYGPYVYGTLLPVSAIYFVSHTVTTTYYIWAHSPNISQPLDDNYTGEGRLWAFAVGL